MNILCLNTSSAKTQIAVLFNGKEEFVEYEENRKSQTTLIEIDKILKKLDADINNFDYFGIVVGVGSFTGLRVGLSIIKGFCMINQSAKVVDFTTLELMHFAYGNGEYSTISNALSGFIFAQDFFAGKASSAPYLTEDSEFKLKTISVKGDMVADDYVAYQPKDMLCYVKENLARAKEVGDVELLYLRKSQAEVELDKKIKQK